MAVMIEDMGISFSVEDCISEDSLHESSHKHNMCAAGGKSIVKVTSDSYHKDKPEGK